MTIQGDRSLAGVRVLVAEDEFVNKLLFEDMLAELGAEVVASVSSADKIAAAAARDRPDVVILDVNLRGELVYGAATALRERGTPFVFVSGYNPLLDSPLDLEDVPRVNKPFRLRELETALREALAQARAK